MDKNIEPVMPEDLLNAVPNDEDEKDIDDKKDDEELDVPNPEELLDDEDDEDKDKEVVGDDIVNKLKEYAGVDDTDDPDELINTAIEKKVVEVLSTLPQELRALNEMVVNGVPLSEAVKKITDSATADGIDSLDPDNEEDAEKLVSLLLRNKGMDDDIIKETVESYKKSGKLATVGAKAKETLAKVYEQKKKEVEELPKKIKEQERKAIEENRKAYEEFVKDRKSIAGFKIDEKEKKELPDYLFTPKVYYNGKKITKFHKDLLEIYADKEKTLALAKIIRSGLDVRKLKSDKRNDNKTDKLRRKKDKNGGLDLAKFLYG